MTDISDLPAEILIEIFSLLSSTDLKSVVLVCKQWMMVGETPTLWTWAMVTLKSRDDLQKLSNRRIQLMNMDKVKVTNWFDGSQPFLIQSTAVRPEELFSALLPITTLTSIEGIKDDLVYSLDDFGFPAHGPDNPDLSRVEPELFAKVLSRLRNLCFDIINPSPLQYEALLSSIAQKDSVKKLVYGFRKMPPQPDLFAAAVGNVEECELGLFSVPVQDMLALLVAIAQEQGRLRRLIMYSHRLHGLSTIAPDILGTAISRLESVCIYQMFDLLSKDQLEAIMKKVGEDASKLKKLEITGLSEEQKEEMDQNLLRQAGLKIGVVEWRTEEVNPDWWVGDIKYTLAIRGRQENGLSFKRCTLSLSMFKKCILSAINSF